MSRKRYLTGPPVKRADVGKVWAKSCQKWADRLWLNRWSLTFTTVPQIEGDTFHVAGKATYTPAYEMATIQGSLDGLEDLPEKKIDSIAAHEMIHLLLAEADVAVGYFLHGMSGRAKALAENQWEEVKERTVTRITSILVHPTVTFKD